MHVHPASKKVALHGGLDGRHARKDGWNTQEAERVQVRVKIAKQLVGSLPGQWIGAWPARPRHAFHSRRACGTLDPPTSCELPLICSCGAPPPKHEAHFSVLCLMKAACLQRCQPHQLQLVNHTLWALMSVLKWVWLLQGQQHKAVATASYSAFSLVTLNGAASEIDQLLLKNMS